MRGKCQDIGPMSGFRAPRLSSVMVSACKEDFLTFNLTLSFPLQLQNSQGHVIGCQSQIESIDGIRYIALDAHTLCSLR
jgi:hypothetical protein